MTDPGVRPAVDAGSAMRPLSGRALVVAALVVVVLTAVVVFVLWWPATRGLNGSELVAARFDALRVGLSIGVGSGGVIVLYLAWRRQRSTEATLTHQERVAETTERDAVERRITDLYTKAADQLGSDKAPVRLAGLYALERLAQDNSAQHRTIVNVLCAYLRMPFDPPSDPPALSESDSVSAITDLERQQYRDALADHHDHLQEQEVRNAAQRILTTHANPGPGGIYDPLDTYWPRLELDLTGATLNAPDFSGCHIHTLSMANASINGVARFDRARFDGDAHLGGAKFGGDAFFREARFGGVAWFVGAEVGGNAAFGRVEFAGDARFDKVKFGRDAWFGEARFGGVVGFVGVKVGGNAGFGGVEFAGDARFDKVKFGRDARFDDAQFFSAVVIKDATFTGGEPHALAASQLTAKPEPPADTAT